MILLALAAASMAQWTGPRTVEYRGPGYFCGGGYRVSLGRGERALVLPQGQAPQATRFVLSGGEVNLRTGAPPQPGKVVLHYPGGAVTQVSDGGAIAYVVSNGTPYGLRIASDSFHGFKSDRWFFNKADFAEGAEQSVACLPGISN